MKKLSSYLLIVFISIFTSLSFAADWLDEDVPSLYQAYEAYFDHVGIACEYGIAGWKTKELDTDLVQEGIQKHANTITAGNEFKPQFIMAWWGNNPNVTSKTFKASNGATIKTPQLNGFGSVDAMLQICKERGIQMRGHVLVWHSQTEEAFFRKDYNKSKGYVSKEEMTARQEWYIKTVLEHVQDWEKKNNKGKKIVWCWDVVNEAVGDGGSELRKESGWYSIYKNYDFIVNAFRFANKYADKDTILCYNDYNSNIEVKRKGMLKVLDKVMAAQNDAELPTRIDAMGMQSHIGKYVKVSDFEKAIQDFLAKGLDVQITELDIATEEKYDEEELYRVYKDYFTMFLNNRKTDDRNGITAIT
ncbi:MAG: endo-1,4-beta-xylanase, partial [Treponema sp.]|nr:endo-1,4-beta-xylanase [Treponema sp.]